MGMTSNEDDIYKLTGLKIGKVYLIDQEYDCEKSNNRLLDCKSGNFHLFPVLQKDNCEKWRDYFCIENKVRKEVISLLRSCKLGDDYSIFEGQGKLGNLKGIPAFYTEENLNHFFRFVKIKKGNRYYTLLFKRFYIDKNYQVNCRFGEIQFYTSLGKDGQINELVGTKVDSISTYTYKSKGMIERNQRLNNILVHYPTSFQGQNDKMIRLSNTDRSVNVYNPKGIKNVFCISDLDIEEYAKQIVDIFVRYINCIDLLYIKC